MIRVREHHVICLMKPKASVLALVLVGAVFAGCDTRIEDSPVEIVEASARDSIRGAGGDLEQWNLRASCVAQGPCHVDVHPRGGKQQVATNRYTVKDSRATLNGADNIMRLVASSTGSRKLK